MLEVYPHFHGLVLKTQDADEAAQLLGNTAVPYRFEPISSFPPFSTEIMVLKARNIIISTATSTGELWLRSEMPDDGFGLVLDLGKGLGTHTSLGERVDVSPDFSFVQNPGAVVEVSSRDRYRVLFLRISGDTLKAELEARLVREVYSPLVFQSAFRMSTSAGNKLRANCRSLRRVLSSTSKTAAASDAVAQLESEIIGLLLESQPHNYSREMGRFADAGKWQLRAAEEYMRSSAHRPLSLGDICAAAGVNARTLQHSFRRSRGCSPMTFLRKVRLHAAHDELLQPAADTTVAGQAAKWGFFHFGRFSRTYQSEFGEFPSQTLQRARRKMQ
ncbi:MAG TPA: helix-turn-helix domain-containing protein [Terriglobales bacterium]|nr:helix-turn-helix domain-containing protein [Terriglobales bacterium]